MKYYIIAGEASGDLHSANLVKEIKALDPEGIFRGWGGDLLRSQGVELVKHYRDLAFMGFTEVILNIRTIFRNLDFCKKDIEQFQPDVLILVDYPGFNLRIAEHAKKKGIKVFYYISPQVWAWKQSRVHKIRNIVDRMFVILPFEKDFYKKFDYDVDFVGHPLLDAIIEKEETEKSLLEFRKENKLSAKPIVALLPGSRKQEITTMLPIMLAAAKHFPDHQFVIAGAPGIAPEFYNNFISSTEVDIIRNKTYDLLSHSKAAIVTSGTATLETAMFKVPEVVCYKGGKISYFIARKLVKVKYISLVNLICDRLIVRELIQDELNEISLRAEMEKLLHGTDYRNEMIANFNDLKALLGSSGASKKTAKLMLSYLKEE